MATYLPGSALPTLLPVQIISGGVGVVKEDNKEREKDR